MMNLLLRAIEIWPNAIHAADDPSSAAELSDIGLIVGYGAAGCTICFECEAPHQVDLKPLGDHYQYFCASLGYRTVDAVCVQLWRASELAVAEKLGAAFGVGNPKWRPIGGSQVYWLGTFTSKIHDDDDRVDLVLACGAPTVAKLAAIQDRTSLKAPARLVLTTVDWSVCEFTSTLKTETALFQELVQISEQRLLVDGAHLRDLLARMIPAPRKQRGAPRKYDPAIADIVIQRCLEEVGVENAHDITGPQFTRVWSEHFPDSLAPSDRQAREVKSEAHARWAAKT